MSTYLTHARHHADKIEHYYAHAGAAGYMQARHHELELEKLLQRAHRSKSGKGDVPVIQAILEGVRPKMAEMKKRESSGDT